MKSNYATFAHVPAFQVWLSAAFRYLDMAAIEPGFWPLDSLRYGTLLSLSTDVLILSASYGPLCSLVTA